MEVFQFNKSMMDRLTEAENILITGKIIPASRVIEEWSYAVELLIEPTGWQAVWKISRVICEELKLKYPTTVYGTVTNVFFKELKAFFKIIAIQDDNINLPENHEVPLIDLWPTKLQENSTINIETTANCLDMIRFFYKNIWMPWDADNDEDIDWPTKHLESRVRFCYDIKMEMNSSLACYVRALLSEAQELQQRREYLELDLSDDEDMNESKSQITNLMHLHVRLAIIRSEMEILENPKLRLAFEKIRFPNPKLEEISFVMQSHSNLSRHIKHMEHFRQIIDDNKMVKMSLSLQDSLMTCADGGKIYVPFGQHYVKYLENLSCSIIAVESSKHLIDIATEHMDETMQTIILAKDFENILLTLSGNVELKNLIFDCRNARTGILIRQGRALIENCIFIGDKFSSVSTAIIMLGNASLTLRNCIIKDFSMGISIRNTLDNTFISMSHLIILNCSTGIECNSTVHMTFNSSEIVQSTHYGILVTCNQIKTNKTKVLLNNINEMIEQNIGVDGSCEFINCKPGNVVLFNKNKMCLLENTIPDKQSHNIDINNINESIVSSDNECSVIIVDD